MKNKILTIIEGRVDQNNWALLKQEYDKVDKNNLPDSLISSYLVQDAQELKIWRIITIWESMDAMNEYRKSVDTPAWILVFKAVNAAPELIINTVTAEK